MHSLSQLFFCLESLNTLKITYWNKWYLIWKPENSAIRIANRIGNDIIRVCTGCAIKIRQDFFKSCTVPGDVNLKFDPDSNSWVLMLSNEVSFIGEFHSKGGQKSRNLTVVTWVPAHKCWWLQVRIGNFCIFWLLVTKLKTSRKSD